MTETHKHGFIVIGYYSILPLADLVGEPITNKLTNIQEQSEFMEPHVINEHLQHRAVHRAFRHSEQVVLLDKMLIFFY